MQEQYVVTSCGIKDKKPYSSLSKIVQGTKESGDSYAFLDDKSRVREDEVIPLGTTVSYEVKRVDSRNIKPQA